MAKQPTEKDTIDLDAFLDELVGKGKTFKLYGKVWSLKPEIPATIMLRLRAETDVTEEEEISLFKQLLDPPEQFDELLEMGLGATAFETIIKIAIGVYSGLSPQEVLENIKNEREVGAEKKDKGNTDITPTG